MNRFSTCVLMCMGFVFVQAVSMGEPAVTIYNQNFGVVRETIRLDLKQGINQISYSGTTAHLEPDSVILRDPSGKHALRILEQNYRADPISQGLLLSLNEGKTIDFLVQKGEAKEVVQGKIIRSSYVFHSEGARRYGEEYYASQMAHVQGASGEPIIEVNGKIQFGLPGQPLFPALPDDTLLKPTLQWILESGAAGSLEAELGYVTGGMSWESSYNLVGTSKDEKLDVVGWVTMDNQSGRSFENARIKLMAGDVSKIQRPVAMQNTFSATGSLDFNGAPPVSEKAFDEYHLYTLERPTTLLDRETKQVEFVRAANVASSRFYVYDGAEINSDQYRGYPIEQLMQQRDYGARCQKKVAVMREVKNSKENGLGIPLPAGRTRFYQRDDDGQLEFTGENVIAHTPQGETLRFYTGSAFDLVGERIQTNFKCENNAHWADESFKITLRNRKKEPVEIRIVEHLYRGENWAIRGESDPFVKTDSRTVEFRVQVKPDEEKAVVYTVHYTW